MKISQKELQTHRKLMEDFIYAVVVPRLLGISSESPEKALQAFRENQEMLLKKYGVERGYIDFDGEIYSLA